MICAASALARRDFDQNTLTVAAPGSDGFSPLWRLF